MAPFGCIKHSFAAKRVLRSGTPGSRFRYESIVNSCIPYMARGGHIKFAFSLVYQAILAYMALGGHIQFTFWLRIPSNFAFQGFARMANIDC